MAVIAIALPLMYWLGAASVGLVTLRKGVDVGFKVFLWALLPAGGWFAFLNDPGPLMVVSMSWGMALTLRSTSSWEMVFGVGSLLGIVTGWLSAYLMPELLVELVELTRQLYTDINPELMRSMGDDLDVTLTALMKGSFAATYFTLALLGLVVARSWQAMLFNPGGFRKEFHSFRLSGRFSLVSVVLLMLSPTLGVNALMLVLVLSICLSSAGLALVHGVIAKKNLGGHWLIAFYVSALFLGPSLFVLLVFVAVADSWFDFRNRIGAPQ
ncbi:MAG: hypothetical protein H7A00_05530 [Hahellaceae bacterium]|nr:hypothetical protein [Hahellaceae bacterium]